MVGTCEQGPVYSDGPDICEVVEQVRSRGGSFVLQGPGPFDHGTRTLHHRILVGSEAVAAFLTPRITERVAKECSDHEVARPWTQGTVKWNVQVLGGAERGSGSGLTLRVHAPRLSVKEPR